jgi:hypothetical protein
MGLNNVSSLKLRNLVSKSITTSHGEIEAIVPPHGSVIYRISAR